MAMNFLVATMAVATLAARQASPPPAPASLVLHGGRIWTGNPAQPEVEAVAVPFDTKPRHRGETIRFSR